MSDPELARRMIELKVKPPIERIIETDIILTALNHKILGNQRVALLACGHRIITSNAHRAQCLKCHQMILAGEDYEAFRNHHD